MAQITPYGSWRSPITSDLIVAGTIRLEQVRLDGDDIYWVEMRPAESGRYVVLKRTPDGRVHDVTPAPFNARTRVHEYGGGSYTVHDGVITFANYSDQRLYRHKIGEPPQPITREGSMRFADIVIDSRRGRLVGVCEDHPNAGKEPVNQLVSVSHDGAGSVQVLVSGHDFYANARLSPDGSKLAYLAWNHPNMPWDGCELWVAPVKADGSLGKGERVAGGPEESLFQPDWSADGELYFVSDRGGWWNLYRLRDGKVEPLCPRKAEFGKPLWVFDIPMYAFESKGRLLCSYGERGIWHLGRLDTATGHLERLDLPYTDYWFLRAGKGSAVFVAGSPTHPAAVVRLDLVSLRHEVLRSSSSLNIDAGYLSVPEPIEFPTANQQTAHAFFYPPKNRDHRASAGEKPPLLVRSHGGPTSATAAILSLEIQFWTSRGFGVLDVNYGGSTGFGREYRQRLNGTWGIIDVDDCAAGPRFLAQRGDVDGRRLVIRGGSAGGFTTLAALTFRDVFQAGASYYGVSDLEALAKDTHKFESRYLDRLIGPYPEQRDLYRQRSPIHFADRLSCPVILFQGLEDKVVPPDQAVTMVEALRRKKLPVAYVPFEGEQHGFRRAENIKRALDAELYFYSRVFGFSLAEGVEPVVIENLP